jgi:putative hydrolase of the HAD superfamily
METRKILRGVVWDWGDTLMRDIREQAGPMVEWPRVEAMPGAALALQALSGLSFQCVATNATESSGSQVAAALDRVGLRTHLTHFLTSSELGVSKPDPGFFEEVSRVLGVPPTTILAVGNDYVKDIVPARAVGMITILVSSEEESAPREAADLIVPSLTDLPDLVGALLE